MFDTDLTPIGSIAGVYKHAGVRPSMCRSRTVGEG